MSGQLGNEFEERRVARLLTRAAEAITPLSEVEQAMLARDAAAGLRAHPSHRRSFARRRHVLSVAAVAAVAALAVSLPIRSQGTEPRSPATSSDVGEYLAAFPEGSALELLLSRRGAQHA